jgi:CheY-like chemotaxis protein
MLRMDGYHVLTASGYHKALEVAAQNPVDLLLCNLTLPDGSGLDLMRSLSEMYNVTGIAISGYGELEDEEDCISAGFVAHLFKPCTFDRVQSALEVAKYRLEACSA